MARYYAPSILPKHVLFSNHLRVLAALDSNPHVTQRELAASLEITERAIQRILHDLEQADLLQRERIGRRTHYTIFNDALLFTANKIRIGDILALLNIS